MSDEPTEFIRAIEEDPSLLQLTDFNGYTIFHWAARNGRLQVMEAINNVDAHMKDRANKYNVTALMWASQFNQETCVKWLLDHDADVNIKSVNGFAALAWATNENIKDMIKKK